MKKYKISFLLLFIFTLSSCRTSQCLSFYEITGYDINDVVVIEINSHPSQSYRKTMSNEESQYLDIQYQETKEDIKKIIDGLESEWKCRNYVYIYNGMNYDTFAISIEGYIYYYDKNKDISYKSIKKINDEFLKKLEI